MRELLQMLVNMSIVDVRFKIKV